MPEFTCPSCGNRMHVEACPVCDVAAAIATPDDAAQGKIMSSGGKIRAGLPAVHDDVPSILKEHHQSFLRIFLSFFLIWTVLIALLAFFAWLGVQRVFHP